MLGSTVDLPGKIVPSASESFYSSSSPSLRILKPQCSLSSEDLIRYMHTPSEDSDESALGTSDHARTVNAYANITADQSASTMASTDEVLASTAIDCSSSSMKPQQSASAAVTSSRVADSEEAPPERVLRPTPLQIFSMKVGTTSLTAVSDTSTSQKKLIVGRKTSSTDVFGSSSISSSLMAVETPPPQEAITPPLQGTDAETDLGLVSSALSPLASFAAGATASANAVASSTVAASAAASASSASATLISSQSPLSAMIDRATAAAAPSISPSPDPSPLKLAMAQAMLQSSDSVGSMSWTSSMDDLSCGSSEDGRSPEEVVNARMKKRENLQQWQELVERIQEHETTITSSATATHRKPSEEIESDMMRRVNTNTNEFLNMSSTNNQSNTAPKIGNDEMKDTNRGLSVKQLEGVPIDVVIETTPNCDTQPLTNVHKDQEKQSLCESYCCCCSAQSGECIIL